MNCPKDGAAMKPTPIDGQTTKQVCPRCGYSRIVETADVSSSGNRRLLTDDQGQGGPDPLHS